MKKFLKILLSFIVLLLVVIVSIPFIFQGKIERYIKAEINKSVNAKVDYKDVSLSLLKDFPNLHVAVKDITVDGITDFDSVRLANIGEFDMSLNFKRLFTDENLQIKKIGLQNADFNILVLKNGKANYDIAKSKKDDSASENTSSFDLKIDKVDVNNLNLNYDDKSMGLMMKLRNFNQNGNGKFTTEKYFYKLVGQADTLDVIFDKIHYINNAKTNLSSDISITNDFHTFLLDNVKMNLNDLNLVSKMKFDMKKDDIVMAIDYETEGNSLKKFLSLVPKAYLPDFQGVKTSGVAKLKGFVKGTYNEKNYPAYGVDFKINNGTISYPDVPENIKNINVQTLVNFKGGSNLDNTVINMPDIKFSIAKNSITGHLKVLHPMTDPYINTAFKGNIDLEKLKKSLKLSKNGINELKGLLFADFSLKSSVSEMEKQYGDVDASGVFHLDNFSLKSDSIPYPVAISRANVGITPKALQVYEFKSKVGKSDFNITGSLDDYLPYLLQKNKTLTADFDMYSQKIDLNEFMSDEAQNQTQDTTSTGYIKVPKNLNIKFSARADEVIYKDINMKDVSGNLAVKDEKVALNTVLSKTFGGEMGLSGVYDTSKGKPVSSMKMNMNKVSIPDATTSLTTFSYYTPVLKKIQGKLFSNLQMKMDLDNNMNPVLKTLDLSGMLESQNIEVAGIDILKKIASLVKINALSKAKIDKVKAQFEIDKGNLNVKPFDFKLNGMKSEMSGKVSLDKTMDFVLKIDIPKAKLGNNANKILTGLVGKLSKFGLDAKLPDIIKMAFKIKGNYNHPSITPMISGYEGQSVKDVVTQAVTDKVNEAVDKAKQKAIAEAQKQADKLMAEAKLQGDKLVGEAKLQGKKLVDESKKIADKIRKEAKKQADELVKKAGNNPFKKLAAQTAAKEMIKQADKKANKLVSEAQKKSDQLVATAQSKSDLLQKNAKTQADKLIEDAKKK